VAMMLSMMLISGILSEQTLRRLAVERSVPEEIHAGEAFTIRFIVENKKRKIPSFALTVSDRYEDGGNGPQAFLLKVGPGERRPCGVDVEMPRRGRWDVTAHEVSTRFPFGLFRKSVRLPGVSTKIVYPAVDYSIELPFEDMQHLHQPGGEDFSQRAGQGPDIRSLRPYQSYDDARRIHWKSSARLQTLMTREMESEQAQNFRVVLDNVMPEPVPPDFEARFERAVSRAASVVYRLVMELELPVSLVTAGSVIPAGTGYEHYIAIMEALALIAPVGEGAVEPDAGDARTITVGVMGGGIMGAGNEV